MEYFFKRLPVRLRLCFYSLVSCCQSRAAMTLLIVIVGSHGLGATARSDDCLVEVKRREFVVKFQEGVLGTEKRPIGAEKLESLFGEEFNISSECFNGLSEVISYKWNFALMVLDKESQACPDEVDLPTNPESRVSNVEKNSVYSALSSPSDRWFEFQWGLAYKWKSVFTCQMEEGVDVKAQAAWNLFTEPTCPVLVAVIDSGVDMDHPDLDDNRSMYSKNFLSLGSDPVDDSGHGTGIAGTIGAEWDSNDGNASIAGLGLNVEMMHLKFLDRQGRGTLSDAIDAIEHAADHHARVANLSWGYCGEDTSLRDALQNAKEVLFVAAAGNASRNNDTNPIYPAAWNLDNLLSVASANGLGFVTGSWGSKTIDIAAPGNCIVCLQPGVTVKSRCDGSSQAAAYGSGTAALVLLKEPKLKPVKVKERIRNSANKSLIQNPNQRPTMTNGLIDACRAVDPSATTCS